MSNKGLEEREWYWIQQEGHLYFRTFPAEGVPEDDDAWIEPFLSQGGRMLEFPEGERRYFTPAPRRDQPRVTIQVNAAASIPIGGNNNNIGGNLVYDDDSDTSGYGSSEYGSTSMGTAPSSPSTREPSPPPSPPPPTQPFRNLVATIGSPPPQARSNNTPHPPTQQTAQPHRISRAYSPHSPVPVDMAEIPVSPDSPESLELPVSPESLESPASAGPLESPEPPDSPESPIDRTPTTTPQQRLRSLDDNTADSYARYVSQRRRAQRLYNVAAPVDTTGVPPPGEVPTSYYVILTNFRNIAPETMELVYRVASRYGTITDYSFRPAENNTINYYVGFYTIPESVTCVLLFPRHLAARAVPARIAATDFIMDEDEP